MPSSSCGVGVAPCDGCCYASGRGNVRPPGGQKRWRAAWKRERSAGWWSRTSRSAPPGSGCADARTRAPSGGASSAPAAPLPSSVLAAADPHWTRTGAPERCGVSPERGDERMGDNEETEDFCFTSSLNDRVPGNKHQKSCCTSKDHFLFGPTREAELPGPLLRVT